MGYRIDPVKGLVFEAENTVPQGITTQPRNINEMRMQPEMGASFNQQQNFSVPPGSMQSPQQWDEDLSVTPIMQPQVVDNQIQPTGQTRANELRQKYGQPGIFDNYESFQPKPRAASFFDSFNSDYNQRLEKEKSRQATGISNFFSGVSIPENQKMPLTMGLLSFGAQLLADSGNNNLFLAQGIGRGLQAGIGGYNAAMTSQQKAAQFQAEQQMQQQRLQMQQARDNVNANYINAQIGQINLQKQNQQNSIDLGKKLRLQLPNLVKSNTISPQEYDIYSNMSDLQLGKDLPAIIQQGPQRETARINLEILQSQLDTLNSVPEVKKQLKESGIYTDQQLQMLEPLQGQQFFSELSKVKPLSPPSNLTKGNARGYLAALTKAGKINFNDPVQMQYVSAGYPLTETKVVKDLQGNETLVTVPVTEPMPAALQGFRKNMISSEGNPIELSKAQPTQFDLTNAEYAAKMFDSQQELDALFKKGYRPGSNVVAQILGSGDVFSLTSARAQLNNASDRLFITQAFAYSDAAVRAVTGAAMPESEFPRYFKMYFVNVPMAGGFNAADPSFNPEFKMMRDIRMDAIRRTIIKAGPGWTNRFGLEDKYNRPFQNPFSDSEAGDSNQGGASNGGGSVYDEEDRKLGGA